MVKRSYYNLALVAVVFLICAYVLDFYNHSLINTNRQFGVSYMTMNNSFYTVIQNSLTTAVEGKGGSLILRDPVLDANKQIAQIEEFIEREVDGIFLNPVDSEKVIPVLEKAAANHIPVVIIDSSVNSTTAVQCSIYSDNYQAGVLCAKDLMAQKDHAKIGLLEHSTVHSGKERIHGFLDTIKDYPEYEVFSRRECYGQTEVAMPQALDMIEDNPEIDTIMALNDPSAIGAIAAIDYLQRNDIQVYGVDGTSEFRKLLQTDSAARATVAQDPAAMGKDAAEAMYSILAGESVGPVILTPIELITRESEDE